MSVSWSHTITLPHPVSSVFPKLSEAQHMERLHKLPHVAQNFTLLASDQVQLPKSGLRVLFSPDHPISAQGLPRPRTIKAIGESNPHSNEAAVNRNPDTEFGDTVERTNIEWSGSLSHLFGLIHTPLFVKGSQIVEERTHTVLYESIVEASGVRSLKYGLSKRSYWTMALGTRRQGRHRTRVKETVWVTCPFYLTLIVKLVSPGVHREVMELYGRLFE